MATEKVFSRVVEADEIIKRLCEKQPEALWCCRPENIAVYGIENKEKSKKNKVLAKIKPIKGSEKFIMLDNNIPIRYVIEVYYSDWREWDERLKQWILFHELLHIHHEIGKTIKHDSEDFKIILDKVGVNWVQSKELPDLVNGDVKFNLELRPSMEDVEKDEEKDEIEEVEDEEKPTKEDKKEIKKEVPKSDEVTGDGDLF